MPTFNPLPKVRLDLRLLGKLSFCPTFLPRPCGTYVLQRVQPGLGNVPWDRKRSLQLRIHVPTNTSNTPAQLTRRLKFAAAVHSWQMLSPAERLTWRGLRRHRNLPGYHNYISAFMDDLLGV